jgi:iron complex transport system permease protein
VAGLVALAALLAVIVAARLLVSRSLGRGIEVGWPGGVLGGIRIDAVLAGVAAGAALGASGAWLQALLRNPLASPFVLGVTSGAGAGVAVAALVAAAAGAAMPQGVGLVPPAAIGAAAALAGTLILARRSGRIDPVTLILGGVIVGAVCAATSTVCESLLPPDRRGSLVGWMLGRIPDAPEPSVLWTCSACAAGLALSGAAAAPWVDAAALSDDEARSAGVPLDGLRLCAFAGCGLATAATVVLCGPIAFIGLLAPHLARALVGAGARALLPGAAVAGAALLVGADAVRQWIDIGGGRLPLGAVTAVCGGVAFLFLLRRAAGRWSA